MSQIEELQGRITAAMDRIGAGIEALSAQPTGDATDDLATALEEEKLANAQLGERLKAIKARHAEELQELRGELDKANEGEALKSEIAALKAELEDALASGARQDELNATRTEAQEARAEADKLRAVTQAQTTELERLRAEAEKATAEADGLRQQTGALREQLDKTAAEAETQSLSMARLDMDVQRVRQSNDQLREVNATLRKANQDGVGEPHLINKAMLAELEGLRASRASDAAEAGAVLSKLETLLANAANLPDGEDE